MMADNVTLPCKCGAEPTLVHMGYYCYRVRCEACGEASTIQATAAIARKKWNKERTAELNAVALAERDARIAELEAEVAALKQPPTYHDVWEYYRPETCEWCRWSYGGRGMEVCGHKSGPGNATGTKNAPGCDRWQRKEAT